MIQHPIDSLAGLKGPLHSGREKREGKEIVKWEAD